MSAATQSSTPILGAFWAVIAILCFSVNDVLIKDLSSDYALHEVIFIRSVTGLLCVIAFAFTLPETRSYFRTTRPGMHLVRALCVVFANLTFFLGLAAMPLADAVAVFFISPTVIAVFSILFLGETVGPRRWGAIAVGLIGVIVVLRPGSATFELAALLPLAAAFGYAMLHILTRRMGGTERAVTMAMSIQLVFFIVSLGFGMVAGGGRFDVYDHPSMEFLFRAWVWPDVSSFAKMFVVGLTSAIGGLCISQAYRTTEAAFVAPFEYIAMPVSVLWGWLVFAEWPDNWTWVGISLIIASGLVLIWREAVARRSGVRSRPPTTR